MRTTSLLISTNPYVVYLLLLPSISTTRPAPNLPPHLHLFVSTLSMGLFFTTPSPPLPPSWWPTSIVVAAWIFFCALFATYFLCLKGPFSRISSNSLSLKDFLGCFPLSCYPFSIFPPSSSSLIRCLRSICYRVITKHITHLNINIIVLHSYHYWQLFFINMMYWSYLSLYIKAEPAGSFHRVYHMISRSIPMFKIL